MKNLNKMKIAPDMQYEIGQDKIGYFPDWDIKDDETLLKKIQNLAHSTFDLTKFTVNGSPVVTTDGIASGFSDNDHLGITVPKFGHKTVFKCRITTGNDVTTTNQYILDNSYFRLWFVYVSNGDYFEPDVRIYDGTNEYFLRDYTGTVNFEANSEYDLEVGFNSITQLLYIKAWNVATGTMIEDTEVTLTNPIDLSSLTNQGIRIGNRGTVGSWTGSIDLKRLEYFADGECVFNGNQTGLDTIKADDYSTVGSPVVTNGIATSLSSSNYFEYRSLAAIKDTNFWEIVSPVYTPTENNAGNDGVFQCVTGTSTNGFVIAFASDGYAKCILQAPNFTDITRVTVAYTAGNQYQFKWVHPQTGVYECWYKINNGNWTLGQRVVGNSSTLDTTGHYLIFGKNGSKVIMDINPMTVKINGALEYQPCLYIPYYKSNTSSKIVLSIYREDVESLFEQEGYNIYYTIGEDTFTLPSHKPNDIVKYKANGLTVAEFRADQTLTIRGACESGTDVNLPMDFYDGDSYAVFGVGTTGTNTASKFTPAADGNYIAIGKGKV